ncbi:hypothetical protein HYT58_01705 [Candidatus Woesearchaeota archaeon]|nr:hypothetical protein [Candidatus Woesearchaeota archaeon]
MSTTIQISNTTRQILEKLKTREKVESYDRVIQNLVKLHTKIPPSMFGSFKELKWKKGDRLDLREL